MLLFTERPVVQNDLDSAIATIKENRKKKKKKGHLFMVAAFLNNTEQQNSGFLSDLKVVTSA